MPAVKDTLVSAPLTEDELDGCIQVRDNRLQMARPFLKINVRLRRSNQNGATADLTCSHQISLRIADQESVCKSEPMLALRLQK